MSAPSDIWSWLSGKTRAARSKGQSIFNRLVKGGAKKSEAKTRALFEIEPRPEQWRKLSPWELEAAGFSRTSKRYTTAPKGGRIVASETISEKAVRNKRALAETGTPLKSSEAPTRLAAGQHPYKSAASEEIAAKQRETASRKRLAREARSIPAVTNPNDGKTYRPRTAVRRAYLSLRDRKLNGEMLDNGDWHGMIDIATAINDPQLVSLRQSSKTVG